MASKLTLAQAAGNPAVLPEQMDALEEFRASLRDSYGLQKVPDQDDLLAETVKVCRRIIREYPAGCKCGRQSFKGGLCRCCQRLFKAVKFVGTLETLSTKRHSEDAALIRAFIAAFAELLAKRDQPAADATARRILSKVAKAE